MCERGPPRAPGMSKMQQNTDRKRTIYDRLLLQQYYTVNRHFKVALPSKLSKTCTCIQTTRFGEQLRTTVHISYTKCVAAVCVLWVYLITLISRESGKLQKFRHVLATRRCCHAIDTPEGIIVVPSLEDHLHVYGIFSGKDSKLRLGFMLHSRALCKLEKTVVLGVCFSLHCQN